jgi:hypothetical protein
VLVDYADDQIGYAFGMPWFSTKAQIIQTAATVVACFLAAYKAWPDMSHSQYFSGGAVLFYVLVVVVVSAIWQLIKTLRNTPSREDLQKQIADLKEKLEEKTAAAMMRDAIIATRDQTIEDLKAEISRLREN